MTTKESFGLLLFVFKFFFSKFGIFLFFLSLNILPSFLNLGSRNTVSQRPILSQTTSRSSFPFNDSGHQKNQKPHLGSLLPSEASFDKLPGIEGFESSKNKKLKELDSFQGPPEQQRLDSATLATNQDKTKYSLFPNEFEFSKDFQRLKKYCIIATIVSLFLNPQQTKYFGGLAVVLKQAGFFSKYSKSEKTVYILSWIFILVFFSNSYYLSLEFPRKL